MKVCSRCKKNLPLSKYTGQRSRLDGLTPHCVDCQRAYRLKAYELDAENYAALFQSQGYACALCEGVEWGGYRGVPATDHNHVTGEVRGILCQWCNLNLLPELESLSVVEITDYVCRVEDYLSREPFMYIDRQRQHPTPVSLNNGKRPQAVHGGYKQCIGRHGCGVWKSVNSFARYKELYQPFCLQCRSSKVHVWSKFRMLPSEVECLRRSQNDVCALCLKAGKLGIDHDHITAGIRGLLCDNCNKNVLPAFERISDVGRFVDRISMYLS